MRKLVVTILFLFSTLLLSSCQSTKTPDSGSADSGASQVEKAKPAAGTGNVQGKVLYNSKPAENIEVKLCETFSRFVSGCGGQSYTAFTNHEGEYLITDVQPKKYEALVARVFDTDAYVFATSGIGISATAYDVVPDKTLFVNPTNLFKGDLKTVAPKAGLKVGSQNFELKWESYPDAAYYKFSIYADDSSVTSPYINERTDTTSFVVDKPLQTGTYRWRVDAFNKDDRKLAESPNDMKFTVAEGAKQGGGGSVDKS